MSVLNPSLFAHTHGLSCPTVLAESSSWKTTKSACGRITEAFRLTLVAAQCKSAMPVGPSQASLPVAAGTGRLRRYCPDPGCAPGPNWIQVLTTTIRPYCQ